MSSAISSGPDSETSPYGKIFGKLQKVGTFLGGGYLDLLAGLKKKVSEKAEDRLHLDGVSRLEKIVASQTQGSTLKKHVWCRASMLVHIPVLLVEQIALQTIRSLTYFLTGMLTLDKQRLKFAAQDALSLPLQLVLLPYFGCKVIGSPVKASEGLLSFRLKYSTQVRIARSPHFSYEIHINSQRRGHHHREAFAEAVEGCSLFPINLVQGITRGITELFSFELKQCAGAVFFWGVLSFLQPPATFICKDAGCFRNTRSVTIVEN